MTQKIYKDDRDLDVIPEPSNEEMEYWIFDGVAEATDGCTVEPDGRCPHGHKSWLLVLGLI